MVSAGWGWLVEADDFWLEYVDARGDPHEGPLEVMWSARFEAAGQVRTFPSYRGQRNFAGWYWAATGAELVGYESWVELGQLMRLDCDPGVVAMASQPFRLSWRSGGRARRISHTPDYFVRRRDGTGVVLDVRPDDRIEPEDAVKFEVTAAACARVGWGFERVGVLDPVLAANLRWLSGYRHPRVRREPVTAELRAAFARPRGLLAGVRAVGDPIAVLPVLFHLLWRRELAVDLEAGLLSAATQVRTVPVVAEEAGASPHWRHLAMSTDEEGFRAFHAEFMRRLPNESSLRTTSKPWFIHQLRVIAHSIQAAAEQAALPASQP
ncbi:TnsA-like heteromeric transposase endonuclease subunit [Streptomyces sp. NRRL WC-3744]|uniref:TnsA-like heteromeric transposase endonuclease subunit n=1 Tax=Streptomyces sp. NRRL WC-3744 TaxID=1463935 RepID=UPI000A549B96|nr:TnsA-like heteromeric transposase endonuclease subunit [Streptomyces sp. NRRL WC-3744]